MFEDIKRRPKPQPPSDTLSTPELIETITLPDEAETPKKPPKKVRFRRFRAWWQHLSRNQRFAVVSAALTVFIMAALGIFYVTRPSAETSIAISKPVVKNTVASPLSGLQVAPDLAKRPVTAIMIENSQDARPQSGLQDAGVIFEAIAEGGITRFLALYQEGQPQYVGPVRSLRPYYIDWAGSFDASVAHVGGSPDALSQIRSGGKDLDEFFNAASYWRQASRPAPHNVFSSFEKLDALNKAKGYTSSKFTPWPRKKGHTLSTPTAKTIDINISSALFNSHYDYDAKSNSYNRSEGGAPHIITSSASDSVGQQLHPKVVIALVASYSIDADGQHSDYGTTGSGSVFVFQDGGVTPGTWTKADRASQFSFTDSKGATIRINAGQVWAVAVADPSMVVYRP